MDKKGMTATVNPRLLAVKTLSMILRDGAYANLAVQKQLRSSPISDIDRRFYTELIYGLMRRYNYLERIISYLTKRPSRKLSPFVFYILLVGTYQLLFMDRIPPRAAINESVKLARKLTPGLHGFVNAVLRNVDRKRSQLEPTKLAKSEIEALSLTYNEPAWIVKRWVKDLGPDETKALCETLNQPSVLTARINTLAVDIESCKNQLEEAGWQIEDGLYWSEAIRIKEHGGKLEDSPYIEKGFLTFMNEASMTVAHVANPKEGMKILDCCAAPGGKSMHMATLMHNKGRILANDIYDHKLALIKENAERLHVSCLEVSKQDACLLPDSYREQFDIVLVDAPCSGLGLLQKKPDLRWRKTEEQMNQLVTLQQQIIHKASQAVKAGGYLIYSTCTLNFDENEGIVNAFIDDHKEFTLEDAAGGLPWLMEGPMLTFWPHKTQTDGFFIAKLHKESK